MPEPVSFIGQARHCWDWLDGGSITIWVLVKARLLPGSTLCGKSMLLCESA
jgi:hypothetical protein